jgi:hypothetical protein
MRKTNPALPISAIAVIAIMAVSMFALQQTALTRAQYFAETGYLVREPFLTYYEQNGSADFFGYPLTDPYYDSDQVLTQTFQNAQLRLTVRGIEMSPLGRWLQLGDVSNGGIVDSAFEAFYTAHSGDSMFGAVIGTAHEEDGLLVQDFERARLVRGTDGALKLGNLGALWLAVSPSAPAVQANIRLNGLPTPQPDIRASISVQYPSVQQGDQQTIYVVVSDSAGNSISGARALAILRYSTGTAELEFAPTNASGLTTATFIVPPAPPGAEVFVEVHVLAGEKFLTTESTYFQWW